ncbi:MerR family transcriptional regulator [Pararhizobium sp.]|uniref:MerR family transcriptional regulator n=1 Tax=Pararhizobium sp. TaxID=1977563 RepID=UPI0027264111|nr:MerR family transcriptional regulator [Pararhizobium sp.]MDO9417323.1 MerR family transcriptional regulator [Pararhizobium sp.]
MKPSTPFLYASEAARRLGITVKALRLYEQRGLIRPLRTAAGWRVFGPDTLSRAAGIVALRQLGLSLAETAALIGGDAGRLSPALAAHQARLDTRIGQLTETRARVGAVRSSLEAGRTADLSELGRLPAPPQQPVVAFDLPWPWGGERFTLTEIPPIAYIIGPLGSGKTRLAQMLAKTLPGAAFIGLERSIGGDEGALQLGREPGVKSRVDDILTALAADGATVSPALTDLLTAMEVQDASILVIDMVEQGLDGATQAALARHFRQRGSGARPLFLMTRSHAILDLKTVTPDEAILFCPANHSPPRLVACYPGAPGYEAMASCLASPEVRARTEGTVAWRVGRKVSEHHTKQFERINDAPR